MGLELIRFSNNPLVKQFQYLRLGSYLRKLLSRFPRSSGVKASRKASIYPTDRVVWMSARFVIVVGVFLVLGS